MTIYFTTQCGGLELELLRLRSPLSGPSGSQPSPARAGCSAAASLRLSLSLCRGGATPLSLPRSPLAALHLIGASRSVTTHHVAQVRCSPITAIRPIFATFSVTDNIPRTLLISYRRMIFFLLVFLINLLASVSEFSIFFFKICYFIPET